MMDNGNSLERRIECESGKLLGRVCAAGIKFWCDKHRREELFTWDQLEALKHSLNPPDIGLTVSDHTSIIETSVL